MTQEFSLNQKMATVLAVVLLVLLFLVFVAGYLSGTLVGFPESEPQPIVAKPAVKPPPEPRVKVMRVPPVVAEPEEVEEIAEPEPAVAPVEKLYSVQVGAFRTQARADTQQAALTEKGYQPYVYHGANSKGAMWYTVRVGDFDDVDDAIMAAREFRALESTSVVLTHYDSLMMVRDDDGRRIEIAPPEEPAPAEAAADEKTVEDDSKTVADEPEAAVDEPETVVDEPEAAVDEPEAVADEPEAVADEPEAAVDEPEAVADEPEAVADEGGSESETATGQSTETTDEEAAGPAKYRITFALPEEKPPVPAATHSGEGESVGGLIAEAEGKQYAVQVGAFLNGENAVKFAEKLRGRNYPAYVFHYTDTGGNAWSAVRTGDFKDIGTARAAAAEFESKESITAIVTKIDAIKMIPIE
jgi:cell division septation protein DedD